jgi:DNA polymerase/3'-5' exonuclease PolX
MGYAHSINPRVCDMEKNKVLANKLRKIASLLNEQKASRFRINAYLNAAKTIENLSEPINVLALPDFVW